MIRHQVGLTDLDHQVFAKCPLDVRKRHGTAIKPHGQAMVMHTRLAKAATAARPGGRNRDALPLAKAVYLGPKCLDNTGDLVAQGHRLLDPYGPESSVLLVVQV